MLLLSLLLLNISNLKHSKKLNRIFDEITISQLIFFVTTFILPHLPPFLLYPHPLPTTLPRSWQCESETEEEWADVTFPDEPREAWRWLPVTYRVTADTWPDPFRHGHAEGYVSRSRFTEIGEDTDGEGGFLVIIGGNCHKYHFCRDKTRLSFCRDKYLSQQT